MPRRASSLFIVFLALTPLPSMTKMPLSRPLVELWITKKHSSLRGWLDMRGSDRKNRGLGSGVGKGLILSGLLKVWQCHAEEHDTCSVWQAYVTICRGRSGNSLFYIGLH